MSESRIPLWESGFHAFLASRLLNAGGLPRDSFFITSKVWGSSRTYDGVMTAYIHYLLVQPDCQGRGIGRQLLEKVKEKYKDYLRIALMAYNKECAFYERCGFTKAENETPMFITSLWT